MRYWFKLSESHERKECIKRGETPKPITLYAETSEIVEDFENNVSSDWWAVYKGSMSYKAGDFATMQEAEDCYYSSEAEEIYCEQHDC